MSEPIHHTVACDARQAALRAFDEKYPNHCRTCGARGSYHSYGGRWDPPSDEPCGCIEESKCPLCAADITMVEENHADYFVCESCGWDERKNDNPKAPEADCECWNIDEAGV